MTKLDLAVQALEGVVEMCGDPHSQYGEIQVRAEAALEAIKAAKPDHLTLFLTVWEELSNQCRDDLAESQNGSIIRCTTDDFDRIRVVTLEDPPEPSVELVEIEPEVVDG